MGTKKVRVPNCVLKKWSTHCPFTFGTDFGTRSLRILQHMWPIWQGTDLDTHYFILCNLEDTMGHLEDIMGYLKLVSKSIPKTYTKMLSKVLLGQPVDHVLEQVLE